MTARGVTIYAEIGASVAEVKSELDPIVEIVEGTNESVKLAGIGINQAKKSIKSTKKGIVIAVTGVVTTILLQLVQLKIT